MYLGFERVAVTNVIGLATSLTIPAEATHAEIQVDTNDVRYTMDDATDPSADSGMIFLTTEEPKLFLIEDVRRIRFVRGGAANGALNIHYVGGRNV